MKKYETSTLIAPFIDVGTYDSNLSWDGMFEWRAYEDRKEGYFICDDFDFEGYKRKIVDAANHIFKCECEDGNMLQEFGVKSIVATRMESPREYNFMSDWLVLEVEVEDSFLDNAEKAIFDPKNKPLVSRYIKDNWETRDGFLSSMPAQSTDEMHDVFMMLREDDCGYDDMRAFGSVLMLLFVIKDEGCGEDDSTFGENYWTQSLVESISANVCLEDVCTVLLPEEARDIYGKLLFFDVLDDAEKQLKEGMEKYAASGVPESAVESCRKELEKRLEKIGDYRYKMQNAVESNHPRNQEKAKDELLELKREWDAEFGGSPKRAKLGDLPGQGFLDI